MKVQHLLEHEPEVDGLRTVQDPSGTEALAAVADVLAQAGQHEQAAAVAAGAETVARSITTPERQAQALAAVASALAARGDTRQARHVASVACAFGRWTTVLGLVLSLEPSTVRVLTDP
jgi:hypothetical protein